MTIKSPVKLFALGFGAIFALTQVGLVGMIARKSAEESRFPTLPVGPYTSYRVVSNADGSYDMLYRANDPSGNVKCKGYREERWILRNEEGKYTDNRNVYNGWSNPSWWAS